MTNYIEYKNEIKIKSIEIIKKYFPESKEIINIIAETDIDDLIQDFSKIYKVVKGIKEQIELKKIELMLKKLKSKKNFEIKLINKKSFYEKLFIVITRIDFEEKIDYLAELYVLLANSKITYNEFFRCVKILENISYEDLENFENKEYLLEDEDKELFCMNGLLERNTPQKNEKVTIQSLFLYKNSRAGNIFLNIKKIKIYNKKSKINN